jgi:hypothetical protein
VQIGETMVFADVNAGGPLHEGGPDSNPLVDPDTLLAVMEQLRVWPE